MSYPQQSCRLIPMTSFMESVHPTLGFPLLLLPSIFTSINVFSKELCLLTMCPKQDSFNFVIFASKNVSGLTGPKAHYSSFWWSRYQRALLHTLFQMNPVFFFPVSLLHCPNFTSVHSNWECKVTYLRLIFIYWIFNQIFYPLQQGEITLHLRVNTPRLLFIQLRVSLWHRSLSYSLEQANV